MSGELGYQMAYPRISVGIAGPISPQGVASALGGRCEELPMGMGGTPVTALAVALARRGHAVVVYSLSPDVTRSTSVQVGPVRMHFGPYRSRARTRAADFFAAERAAIESFVRDDPADVVHAHWTYEFALGTLSARPDAVVTVHDWSPAVLSMSRDVYRFVRFLMDRRCIGRARHLTCVSPCIRERLRRAGHAADVVPNMVSSEEMGEFASRHRRAHRILAANTGWGHWKNVETLLLAFAQFKPSTPDAELVLCGAGYGPGEDAERWACSRGLCDGVRFLGTVDHPRLLNLMRGVDLFVHPSLEESFGLALAEAMAQGTPVIGGVASGAVPWVLGDAGMLVDVSDPSAIADAIGKMFSDDAAWLHYSRTGRLNVESRFSESAVVERYLAVYRKVLGE